jgi:hypothetical protein
MSSTKAKVRLRQRKPSRFREVGSIGKNYIDKRYRYVYKICNYKLYREKIWLGVEAGYDDRVLK